MFILLVMLYFGSIWCENLGVCKPFKLNQQHFDKQLMGHGFFELESGHHDCVRNCWYLSACKSIDYDRPKHTCRLNDADTSSVLETEFETRALAIYSDINEWPSEMAGSCGSRPCSPTQMCVPTNPPQCMDIICGDVPPISNGNIELVVPEGNKLLGVAVVTCNEGYLTNQSSITCQVSEIPGKAICVNEDLDTLKCHVNGKWETSTCELADCGEPIIGNGIASLTDPANTTYMATAAVTCNAGYETTTFSITCQASATWEPVECSKISCGSVPYLANGKYTLASAGQNLYLDTAVVACNYGYTASVPSIKCQSSKQWTTAHCACMPIGSYMGTLSKTKSGHTCQRWDSQSPHPHSEWNTAGYFPDSTLSAVANYCRSGGEAYLWCYTITSVRWEECTKPQYIC
ncbi:uncharacterized protein LOC123542770 [Mercenaria mercenaria]|uniref:uncharacterized protein LOC123542770 n=1 Tax=Mercenaria mercenaria TaxID=6596 RepID=UPI00234F2C30|nr:uncharacterized protein LOC123542770 [Mercenaria mercenaria]